MREKQKVGRVILLPLEWIEPSPYQARTVFDDNEIAALAVSILQNGLLQPVSVRRLGLHRYQLVAGERRLRACRLAQLQKIPAILSEFDESESAALGLLENMQRAQLDPFDTARGIREVIRLWGCTQAEAARRLGLSQSALANKLRLLSLTEEQQKLCTEHRLTERHARAALRLPDHRRTEALEKNGAHRHERAAGGQAGGPDAQGRANVRQAPPPHHPHGGGCAVLCEHLAARGGPDDPEGHPRHHPLHPQGRLPGIHGAHPRGTGRGATARRGKGRRINPIRSPFLFAIGGQLFSIWLKCRFFTKKYVQHSKQNPFTNDPLFW